MRYQTENNGEFTYLLGEFLSGETVTIGLYELATGSVVTLDSSSCSEIGATGWFRWSSENITTPATAKTEYLYIMTDSNGYTYSGKFIVGGYPDNVDALISSRSNHSAADVWELDSGSIDAVIEDKKSFGSNDFNLSYVLNYWKDSIIRFTSGANKDILREIETSTSTGGFVLREETPHSFAVGDTFVITPLFSFGSTRDEAIGDKDSIISEVNDNETKIDIIGANVDEVLADTDELQTNQGAWATATGFATQNPPSQNLDDYKADVSALSLEATSQSIKAKTDTISWADVQEILKLTGYKVTKSGDIITIYEADGTTIWRQYDLADGGRVEV